MYVSALPFFSAKICERRRTTHRPLANFEGEGPPAGAPALELEAIGHELDGRSDENMHEEEP